MFCGRGGRKPSYGVGFQNMVPPVWRQIWNESVDCQKRPGAENSVVLLEAYSLDKAISVGLIQTVLPHRGIKFNAVVIPWYNDTSLDGDVETFGRAVRDLWRSSDGLHQNFTWVFLSSCSIPW